MDFEKKKEAFYQTLGAKFTQFCGLSLPLQYKLGAVKENLYCRETGVIFDVSHMGLIRVQMNDDAKSLDYLSPSNLAGLAGGRLLYTCFLDEKAAILEDAIVICIRKQEEYVIVVNTVNKYWMLKYLRKYFRKSAIVLEWLSQSILAIQGPAVARILKGFRVDIDDLPYRQSRMQSVFGIDCRISRCGYTGEDGVELIFDREHHVGLLEKLLADGALQMAGLAARDSLRIEAGLCLYGRELSRDYTVPEANLEFVVSPKKRQEAGPAFRGKKKLIKQLQESSSTKSRIGLILRKNKGKKRKTGLILKNPRYIKPNTAIYACGKKVGFTTSYAYSPMWKSGICMAYIERTTEMGSLVNLTIPLDNGVGEIPVNLIQDSRWGWRIASLLQKYNFALENSVVWQESLSRLQEQDKSDRSLYLDLSDRLSEDQSTLQNSLFLRDAASLVSEEQSEILYAYVSLSKELLDAFSYKTSMHSAFLKDFVSLYAANESSCFFQAALKRTQYNEDFEKNHKNHQLTRSLGKFTDAITKNNILNVDILENKGSVKFFTFLKRESIVACNELAVS